MRSLMTLTVQRGAPRGGRPGPPPSLDGAARGPRLPGRSMGASSGECGTCTVLVDGQPVLSRLALAIECQDVLILTVEGLAEDDGSTPPAGVRGAGGGPGADTAPPGSF